MTWSTAVSMLIVYKMLLTLYDMVYCGVHVDCPRCCLHCNDTVYCGVHVDCVQDVSYILRNMVSMLIVYKMLLTLYDMVYCDVHVDCVQDVTNIVRHGLLQCPC